jgi:hypothetical protein
MYAPIIRNLPEELRLPMLELAETIEQTVRSELAVRREDFESLEGVVREVAEMHYKTDQRQERLESALADLAEAQARTEGRMEELAEVQARTEQRVDRLEVAVAELTEAQKRTEQRVAELAEAQKRTEQRVEELAEAQRHTEQILQALITRVDQIDLRLGRVEIKVDSLRGDQLHRTYRERAHGYFGRILRRVHVVNFEEIEPELDERLPAELVDDLRLLDLIVQGRHEERSDLPELWLAVEVSAVIDRNDVTRAQRRAAILRQAGYLAVAAVAGEQQTESAEDMALANGVVIVRNGTVQYWDEALGTALA